MLGSPLEDSPFCSSMSRETGALVLNVDYRLGPTDTFPAAIEEYVHSYVGNGLS